MRIENELEIAGTCRITHLTAGDPECWSDVSLCYTEHSPDSWYSDTETEITLDKSKAIEIIDFLKVAFKMENSK